MFGKRKGREPVQQPEMDARRRETAPAGIGKLGTVIVRRSAVAKAGQPGEFALVQAVVDFVNAMTGDGQYTRFELANGAMQAYHADFYLAQVNNGGHSQFIHNCFQNLPFVIADVRAALTAMKADAHLAIFEKAAAWIAANPEEAKKQTGFQGGRAPELDELDRAFYAADKAAPMIEASSRWILTWPELRPVDDGDYQEAIRRVVMLNPMREARLMANSIRNLVAQTMDWFQVGVGLACANGPRTEIKLSIGGGSIMEIEGEQQMAFYVRTNAPQGRYCVVTKAHAALYERVEPPAGGAPARGDGVSANDAIISNRGRYVGAKLSQVKRETIEGVIELAGKYMTAAAIDLLLRRAQIDPRGAAVSPKTIDPRPDGPIVDWLVAAGGRALVVLSHPNGSALLEPGMDKPLAIVRKDEVEAHARTAASGVVKVPGDA